MAKKHPVAVALSCEHLDGCVVTGKTCPQLGWQFQSELPGAIQAAYRVLVASSDARLAADDGDFWDSGMVQSGDTIDIRYAGKALPSRAGCFWKVKVWDGTGSEGSWSETAQFRMGLLSESDWQSKWIGLDKEPYAQIRYAQMFAPVYLRKEFAIGKELESATLYASALGWYEFRINGQRVGHDYFTPGWTDYRIRLYYNTYDVTALLKQGQNAIGGVVAGGWHNWPDRGGKMRLLGQLELQFKDGSSALVATDGSWRGALGPERYAHLLLGESCDMRKAIQGWDTTDFDASKWEVPVEGLDPGKPFASKVNVPAKPALEAYPSAPVRVYRERKPAAIKSVVPGEMFVLDMGAYYTGFVRLKIKGAQRGQLIRLRYGDWINKDGTLFNAYLRLAVNMADEYICSGAPEETWEPRFTFHGHRYVEITGWPDPKGPSESDVVGIEITQYAPDTISFACGSPMLNKLFESIGNTRRACFIEAPIDCPQRDERQGWFGDALIFANTANYQAQLHSFYRKWMVEILDSQHKGGGFARLAPNNNGYWPDSDPDGGPIYADISVVLPWKIYRHYGDREVLQIFYQAICRYVEFRKTTLSNWLRDESKGIIAITNEWYGDWLAIDHFFTAETSEWGADTSICYAAYTAKMFMTASKIAAELGHKDDAAQFQGYFENVKQSFNQAYVDEHGMKHPTQGNCALALAFQLVDGAVRALVSKQLRDEFRKHDWNIGTGIFAAPAVLPALCSAGHPDEAYSVILKETYPSWGYMIKSGAASIWERWYSRRTELPEDEICPPGRGPCFDKNTKLGNNSACHPALGAVGEWMVEYIGGISPLEPGFKKIRIKPLPDARVGLAEVTYLSPMGKIRSAWTLDGSRLRMEVATPANTKAEIWVPAKNQEDVQVSGDKAVLHFSGMQDGCAVFTALGGSYVFDSVTSS